VHALPVRAGDVALLIEITHMRSKRYLAEMIMRSMARVIRISKPAEDRPGVPMTHSSARKMTSRMNVVPRSSPVITSKHSRPAPGMSAPACAASRRAGQLLLTSQQVGAHTTRASLAISDGWICCPPMDIHRAAPFCETPTPWISVSPSRHETASSG